MLADGVLHGTQWENFNGPTHLRVRMHLGTVCSASHGRGARPLTVSYCARVPSKRPHCTHGTEEY
jgi:hypothetical protein